MNNDFQAYYAAAVSGLLSAPRDVNKRGLLNPTHVALAARMYVEEMMRVEGLTEAQVIDEWKQTHIGISGQSNLEDE